jgi:hypothetical protein
MDLIVNVYTNAYLALLDDDDRSDVVTVTLGLLDKGDQGTQVGGCGLTLPEEDITYQRQWRMTHLGGEQYKIQNVDFNSFISHDHRPQVDDPVLGKPTPIQWLVQLVQSPNVYT